MSVLKSIKKTDSEISALIKKEERRQKDSYIIFKLGYCFFSLFFSAEVRLPR